MITFDEIKKINSPETRTKIAKKTAAGHFRIKIGKYEFYYDRSGRKHFKHSMLIEDEKSGYYATAFDFDYNQCWTKLIGSLCMDAMSAEQAA